MQTFVRYLFKLFILFCLLSFDLFKKTAPNGNKQTYKQIKVKHLLKNILELKSRGVKTLETVPWAWGKQHMNNEIKPSKFHLQFFFVTSHKFVSWGFTLCTANCIHSPQAGRSNTCVLGFSGLTFMECHQALSHYDVYHLL